PPVPAAAPPREIPPPQLDPALRDTLVPGLIATYRSTAAPDRTDARRISAAALYVAAGHAPSSFLPGGP
ncbi:MAG: hypothetical protein GTO03_00200, partial [Planctomycetales bacterium]|nr:hypothetical protein [Planctomycetales bacterium]